MYEATFQKYVIVVVLFAVFLLLANLWAFKSGRAGRRHVRRRRPRRHRVEPGDPLPEIEPIEEPQGLKGFLREWSVWLSVIALAVCIAALGLMWWVMVTVGTQGG